MEKLKNIPLSYGIRSNYIITKNMNFITTIKRFIFLNEPIPDFDSMLTENNLNVILNKIIFIMDDDIDLTEQFYRICQTISVIVKAMDANKIYDKIFKYDSSLAISIIDNFKKINNKLYDLLMSNFYTKTDKFPNLLCVMHNAYDDILCAIYKLNHIDDPIMKVTIVAVKDPSIIESSIMNTTSYKIYSVNSPNGTNIVGRYITEINPDNCINPLIDINASSETILGNLSNIVEFFDIIKNSPDEKSMELLKSAICNSYNILKDNTTGLKILKDKLMYIGSSIINIKCLEKVGYDAINELDRFIKSMINTVTKRIIENESDVNINESYDILAEMGLSFIYTLSEDLSGEGEIEAFNEGCNKFVSDDLYDDVLICMTEGAFKDIRDNIKNKLGIEIQKNAEKRERSNELREQRNSARVERSEMRREQRLDHKMELKNQRDIKREEQREAKREQRKRNMDTFMYKNKVVAMTDPNARKMMRVLKSTIAAIVGTGTGAALFGKQTALLTGALGFLGMYSSSKACSSYRRSEIANYIQTELKVIDSKIDDLERVGDTKNKARLMRLKSKMETTYKAMVHCLPSGELTYLA